MAVRPATALMTALWLATAAGGAYAAASVRVPNVLADAAGWKASASDDVTARVRAIPHGVCLDYNLHGTAGYASIEHALPLALSGNYAFNLRVRGDGAANTLQFKLVHGNAVWWHTWANFAPPAAWKDLRIGARAISFAWGPPHTARALTRSDALMLTIAAGKGGGHGSVCFDRLTLTRLPPAPVAAPAPPTLTGSPNAYFMALASRAPRGFYPRGFTGQQVYWTLVGIDGGRDSGLLSEDGALEVGKGGFTLEPFLLDAGKLVGWADVATQHSLLDGYLPIPTATWHYHDLQLGITAFAAGARGNARLLARYTLRNTGNRAREVTLALAARPFQVDPPTQFLNAAGGVSPIHRLAWQGNTLVVDGKPRVRLLEAATGEGATTLAQGAIVQRLAHGDAPSARAVDDPSGFASGAALYCLHLPAHASRSIAVVVPLAGSPFPQLPAGTARQGWLQQQERAVAAQWRARLDQVTLRLPPAQQRLADTLRSSLAWILISRDGAELRPGTRSYARSWIRDGAMMSDALLRLGDSTAAREYALWYAPHQFSTGKIPCCVDARGPDPTPENDSPGEFLHLVAQVYRYTHDRAFLASMWPDVLATVGYVQRLIASQSGPACAQPATRMFCGLMPASISHEGYPYPEHSYWDDFWMLTGWRAAVDIAAAMQQTDDTAAWQRQRHRFQQHLYASIRESVGAHHIDYIPGSAELGDFDATSTTIALEPGGQLQNLRHDLPRGLLKQTFERYWQQAEARIDGSTAWTDYTPYEWRNVGVFARLGWRTRIPPLLDFFFAGQRPQGWNGWAEVVGRKARKPRFIGDLPHAWVASDYIRAALDLFAYARYRDHALVLDAGVQPAWLEHGGIALGGLHTPWGKLAYSLRRDGAQLVWHIDAGVAPPGGVILTWPLADAPGATRVNGQPARWSHGELRLTSLPASVTAAVSGAAAAHATIKPAPRRSSQ